MKKSSISITKIPSSRFLFLDFRRLLNELSKEEDKNTKLDIVRRWVNKGAGNKDLQADLHIWCTLLVPQTIKRHYKLRNIHITSIFCEILNIDHKQMADGVVEKGLGETIKYFFENNDEYSPAEFSTLTIREVSDFLKEFLSCNFHSLRIDLIKRILPSCTANDLKIIICLLKKDLQIKLHPKDIIQALDSRNTRYFRSMNDFHKVINDFVSKHEIGNQFLMSPICPMLAEPCKSLEQAMKKFPNGLLAEIKYDGERIQIHKKGCQLQFFSRNLNPTNPQKVEPLHNAVLAAFQNVDEIIVDSELVLIDVRSGEIIPLCTCECKTRDYTNADVCIVVFDCVYIDGIILTNAPLRKRRKYLEEKIVEISKKVVLSEKVFIQNVAQLSDVIAGALTSGIEGLILKDVSSSYTPGMREWLKIKREYLIEGKLPDSIDLIVLGAWYGSGKYSEMMTVFLMGCYDEDNQRFVTVTEVTNGLSSDILTKLQKEMDMEKIDQDPAKCPKWLQCSSCLVPDLIAKDPKKQPVWEITGVEFIKHDVHTAGGISLKFPKVSRFRHDKNWRQATSLNELKNLSSLASKMSVLAMLKKEGNKSEHDNLGRKRTDESCDGNCIKKVKFME